MNAPFQQAPASDAWLFGTEHADGADIAAAIFNREGCAQHCVPFDDLLGPKELQRWGVQPGDPTRTIGLYTRFPGEGRMTPIVRSGIIAAMPEELYQRSPYQFRPYLVETRSIQAMSGSPVYVVIDADRELDGPSDMTWRHAYVAGVNHGGWKLQTTTTELVQWSEGISIAVPAAYLIQLLKSEAAVDQRDKLVEAWDRA